MFIFQLLTFGIQNLKLFSYLKVFLGNFKLYTAFIDIFI